uniref:Phosphoribosyltransferase n=1 Tax=uncultured Alphaproteobacteria bacterium TaxID=91750 RepID=A0A6G8F304_9PROT|nr:phosphoribosyltransferase [uncultured Alphaproteobacteria bacterium]
MLYGLFEKILDFILPYRCMKCGRVLPEPGYLCDGCSETMNFIGTNCCRKCGHPLYEENTGSKMLCAGCLDRRRSFYRLSRSAVIYDESSKNLILGLKFLDRTENANLLAAMLKVAGKDIFEAGADVLIPVPLHYTRLIKRRYNQSSLLAVRLGKMVGLPVDNFSLIKHKRTRPQTEFSGRERVANVKGVFSVRYPERIKGKRVILIDDVMTTGSTLKESSRVLRRAGAKSIDILTVARVVG